MVEEWGEGRDVGEVAAEALGEGEEGEEESCSRACSTSLSEESTLCSCSGD